MTIVVGYSLALLVGISLGIFGAGGSILTVPILVYVVGIAPVEATAYSLVVVGLTSLIGALAYIRRGEVHLATATIFAIPSVVSVYLTRRLLVPAIPETLASLGGVLITRDLVVMVLFGLLMAWASVGMIRGRRVAAPALVGGAAVAAGPAPGAGASGSATGAAHGGSDHGSWPLIAAEGMGVGVLTGLVGAGGGFLIVPVLVLAAGMAMREAVGTSLIIISLKSLVGFLGDLGAGRTVQWEFLGIFSALAVLGVLAGTAVSSRVPGERIKPWFGWFVLIAGVLVVGTEFLEGGAS